MFDDFYDTPSVVEATLFTDSVRLRQYYIDHLITFPHAQLIRPTYFPIAMPPLMDFGHGGVFNCEYLRLLKCDLQHLPTLDKDFIRAAVIPYYKKHYAQSQTKNKETQDYVYSFLDRFPTEITGGDEYEGLGVKVLPIRPRERDKLLWIYQSLTPSDSKLNPIGRQAGWLFPEIIREETLLIGRWRYLGYLHQHPLDLATQPIPQINFDYPDPLVTEMLEKCIRAIDAEYDLDSEDTRRGRAALHYFLDWLLWSLGHDCQPNFPLEQDYAPNLETNGELGIWDGRAHNRLLQIFNPTLLLAFPSPFYFDYLLTVCPDTEDPWISGLYLDEDVLDYMEFGIKETCTLDPDPTHLLIDFDCGTGSSLMLASNYTLEMMGVSDDPLLAKMTIINSYFYAPWNVFPIKSINRDRSWLVASGKKSFAYNYIYNWMELEEYHDCVARYGHDNTEYLYLARLNQFDLQQDYATLMPVGIKDARYPLYEEESNSEPKQSEDGIFFLPLDDIPVIGDPEISFDTGAVFRLEPDVEPQPAVTIPEFNFVCVGEPSPEPHFDFPTTDVVIIADSEPVFSVEQNTTSTPILELPSPQTSTLFALPPAQDDPEVEVNFSIQFETEEIPYDLD